MIAKRPIFPFAALVGQERLKKALILNAINPLLGGVLIRGEKGTAKSTAARGLAQLLPPIKVVVDCPFHCDPEGTGLICDSCRQRLAQGDSLPSRERPMPVVDLPLGTTEDRLLGTIDLEKAIKTGEKHFEPGILAAAHRGILYVDEVNLLDDHLVDVLLDAAAMGMNVVEREGISFSHPARFILVGTMNPEEGELRPQLLDRFGLCVEVAGLPEQECRMEVMQRWLAFEADPESFCRQWQPEQEQLRQLVQKAREGLPQVRYSTDILRLISRICLDQGVDGHRADLFMLKVAQTLAAYHGRQEVREGDVREAAELVLLHRLRRKPFSEPRLEPEKLEESIRKHQEQTEQENPIPQPPPPPEESPPHQEASNGTGEVTFESGAPFPVRPLDFPRNREIKTAQGRRTQARTEDRSGRYVRPTITPSGPPDLAIDATLRAAAPYQKAREKDNLAMVLAESDLRHKVREKRIGHHILFAVDASGSMGANQRMVETKAAILSLLLDAYQKREQVGLLVFRGETAQLVLPFTNSIEQARKYLEELPTGGKTPLPHALQLAYELLHTEKARHPRDAFLLVLISDGKANVSMGHNAAITEAKELAGKLRELNITSLVLDTDTGLLNLGCLSELSDILKGRYYRLEELQASEVVARIEDLLVT